LVGHGLAPAQHYALTAALGAERAHVVAAFDINDAANAVYRANFPDTPVNQVRRRRTQYCTARNPPG